MKTINFLLKRKNFCKALIMAVWIGMTPADNLVAMPLIPAHDVLYDFSPVTESPEKIQALAYCLYETSVMVLNLENPGQENVNIQIRNSRNEIIYKKNLGKPDKFIGKFNLQELPNDNYTLVVYGADFNYSKSFALQTKTSRIIKIKDINH